MSDVDAQPLKPRAERFAHLVADGTTYLSAWCESAEGHPKPEPTASARVQASRMAKRCADRIAYLKTQKAGQVEPLNATYTLTAASLKDMMEGTTQTLVKAANAAQRAGSEALAQNLRRVVVTHSGRAHRVETRSPKSAENSPNIPVADYVARLQPCVCSA